MKQLYDVYINSRLKSTGLTKEQAWDLIGKRQFGDCYMVYFTGTYLVASEFVPY